MEITQLTISQQHEVRLIADNAELLVDEGGNARRGLLDRLRDLLEATRH